MKITLYHVFYFLVLALAVLITVWGMIELSTKKVVEEKIEYNTTSFEKGDLVAIDDGVIRLVFPRDTNAVLGIVTECDVKGEIVIKYVK